MVVSPTPADALRVRMLATGETGNPHHRIAVRLLDDYAGGRWPVAGGRWLVRLGAAAAHYCRPGTVFLDWHRVGLGLAAGELGDDAAALAVLAVAASLAGDHEINLREVLGVLGRRDRRLVLKAVSAVPVS
ncbi:hypothetical protein ACFVZ3_14470 [Kitasatospora purpeofusca]|uniref:hypothetical protein n=1 Tax=Kitasatospora purpeofusca TaxID=67352 RepID=UPI0036CCF6A1